MENNHSSDIGDLHEIIDQKITAIMREMENAGYNARETALAIVDVVNADWLDRDDALRKARAGILNPSPLMGEGCEDWRLAA